MLNNMPSIIGSCLYSGISKRIDHLKMVLESDYMEWDHLHEKDYTGLPAAVEWYKENLILSAKYLVVELEELVKIYEANKN
jgi:hypothetical protein